MKQALLTTVFTLLGTSCLWSQSLPEAVDTSVKTAVESAQVARTPFSKEEQALLKKHQISVALTPIQAEGFEGLPVNVKEKSLDDYKGSWVLLNFWATWCVPCRKELPDMEELYLALRDQGFVVLAVAMGEDQEKVEKFLKKRPLSFPIFADPDMTISKTYGVRNIPVSYLLSPDRLAVARAIGPREWNHSELRLLFKKHLDRNQHQ